MNKKLKRVDVHQNLNLMLMYNVILEKDEGKELSCFNAVRVKVIINNKRSKHMERT